MEDGDPVTQRSEARIGTTLKEKWKLDRLLGVGGMAAVYSATHRNGKRVAVKILHAEMSIDTNIRQRFLREGYAANRVGHRGAVTVDDDDTLEDGSAFLVMELLEGETLDARMRRKGGRLPQAEVLSLADQILDTLVAAHEKDIVHRDLKPENVFMTKDGVVKVLDFGIARIRELSSNSNATLTGSLMGTPAFMPPEQALGRWEEVDSLSDLWAVGATLFMLLTGAFVHESRTPNEALILAATARPRSIAEREPDLHPAVVELIDRSLSYEKEGRFQTASEMQEAVRAAYRALEGSLRMPALSIPDPEEQPEAPVIVAASEPKPSTLTTGRGVAASLDADAPETTPSARKTSSAPKPVLLAAAAGGLLLVVGGVLLSRGGDPNPTPEPGAPTGAVPAAAPPGEPRPTSPNEPEVTPAPAPDKPRKSVLAVPVDALPVDKEERKEAAKAAAAGSAKPEKPAALAPASSVPKAAAGVPAWLQAAAAPSAKPPPPKKPVSGDPFSKRF